MNCWEFKHCGRQANGENAERLGVCPAYTKNAGQACWLVEGTYCESNIQPETYHKQSNCPRCKFFIKYEALHRNKISPLPPRNGELAASPSRSKRVFLAHQHWYFDTREGITVGPFDYRALAENALDNYIAFMHSAPNATIKTFLTPAQKSNPVAPLLLRIATE